MFPELFSEISSNRNHSKRCSNYETLAIFINNGILGLQRAPWLPGWESVKRLAQHLFFYFGFVNRHLAWFTDIKPHKAYLSCIDISANRIWESQIKSLYDFSPRFQLYRFSTCPHLSFRWSLTKNSSKRHRRGVGGRWGYPKIQNGWFIIEKSIYKLMI